MKSLPSLQYLQECFDYNQSTGELRWRWRPLRHFAHIRGRGKAMWLSRFPGKIAGRTDGSGARQVVIDHEAHLVHRVIWKLMTGADPEFTIDHKNRDPGDNRWDNLRLASQQQQIWNTARRGSFSGEAGIQLRNGRYGARVTIGGKDKRLGSFATLEEAKAVRAAAYRELRGEFFCEDP